ncbi:MAG TPA: OmpA family protein [Nitrospirae bacterium]|nr:outer membrane porin F precursor [bacterium BMS3Abin10]GBE38534.1 outer membrane porin F precursor [bacterium BMS3Bbin08]HDH50160.1 OmpA family protein [Nitrospirota bacterium]HDK17155.1 OmpA family protein [Nitrospirota bacterium]HDO25578.1 OmpA family protein [Nitrospirota bacterium]
MNRFISLCLMGLLALTTACATPQTKTQKGAAYGAGGGAVAGAIAGALIAKDTEGALIGAAIGAAVGGLAGAGVGKMMDNQERDLRQALADSEAAAVRREGNLLTVSLKGNVTFDFDSAVVKPGLYSEIYKIADALNRYPRTLSSVEGHTDSIGSESYNVDLSTRRATAVKDLLLQRGVAPHRVEAVGYGESMPVATNETEAGRLQNRRVEIKIAPSNY